MKDFNWQKLIFEKQNKNESQNDKPITRVKDDSTLIILKLNLILSVIKWICSYLEIKAFVILNILFNFELKFTKYDCFEKVQYF